MSLGTYRCLWVFVGVYGCLWVSVGIDGFLGIYVCLWVLEWLKKKTRFCGNQLLFDFLKLHVEKKLAKAVACTMIFNTASTMTNLSLNSQNRLFSRSGIGLLIGILVFHLIKMSFGKPEGCAIIFSTASPVFKFIK